jgi:hypothetical protein
MSPSERPLLFEGETLDSIWAKYGDRCVMCSAPKAFLIALGIGRQVHHFAPYAKRDIAARSFRSARSVILS